MGNTVGDKASSMSRQDLTKQWDIQWETQWEKKWETKWETKPDPCRDKISQSSRRYSERKNGGQSRIYVVTTSHRAVGHTVGGIVRDKVEDTVGDKARSMS